MKQVHSFSVKGVVNLQKNVFIHLKLKDVIVMQFFFSILKAEQ